jgi:integrase
MVARGWSRKYVNSQVGHLVRMFRWAVAEELLPPSAVHALAAVPGLRKGRTVAPDHQPVGPVEEAVVEATLPHLRSVVADMVQFQRLTGCRPSEVCIVRPCDVDRSGEVWEYTPESHKTEHHGRGRLILVGPKAQAILMPYLLRAAESYCFSPQETVQKQREERHAARVTPLNQGNVPGSNQKRKPGRPPRACYTADSYRRAIHRALELANQKREEEGEPPLEKWSPNRLRHSAGTEIRRRYGLEAAQVVLGHAQADVTQVYAERDLELARRVIREVG